MITVKIICFGVVQGVFFRANVEKKALELGLKGYVTNLDDGSVEIVVVGKENKVDELIIYLEGNPGRSKIESLQMKKIKEDLEFSSFSIK